MVSLVVATPPISSSKDYESHPRPLPRLSRLLVRRVLFLSSRTLRVLPIILPIRRPRTLCGNKALLPICHRTSFLRRSSQSNTPHVLRRLPCCKGRRLLSFQSSRRTVLPSLESRLIPSSPIQLSTRPRRMPSSTLRRFPQLPRSTSSLQVVRVKATCGVSPRVLRTPELLLPTSHALP